MAEQGADNDISSAPVESKFYAAPIQAMRCQIFIFFEIPESSMAAKSVSIFILVVILTSICCFVLETVQEWQDNALWGVMEIFSTATFTIEYSLRFWTCDVFGWQTHRQFFLSPMNMLDFLAIIPYYVEAAMTSADVKALRVLRSIRLIRLFRVFKLGRYNSGMLLMTRAIRNSLQALSILLFFLGIGVILFSALLFYGEKLFCPSTVNWSEERFKWYADACEVSTDGWTGGLDGSLCCDENGNQVMYPSIMHAMWWSMVTMTTVGFGDQVPRTSLGKIIAGTSMLCGILLISLPVAIVGSKFQEAYDDQIKEAEMAKRTKLKADNPRTTMPRKKEGMNYKASNFIYLHRKHRVNQIRQLLGQFHGATEAEPRAKQHLQEILRLLEESEALEKKLVELKTKDRKVEQQIAKGFEQLLSKTEDTVLHFTS